MNKSFDYLLVGLGLAGSVLAKMLLDRGKSVLVIDEFNPNSSSQVAAGLVNPVTGRRVVKSWMANELIPFAKKFYNEEERTSGLKFYHEVDLLEIVHSVKEVNDWTSRMHDESMSKYITKDSSSKIYEGKIAPFHKMFRITSSGWMNIPAYINIIRQELLNNNSLVTEKFDHTKLIIGNTHVEYGDQIAKRIIFCEGVSTLNNPLWNWLPFLPAKGEILTINCERLPEEFILMSGFFIVPLGNHKFRMGSTYEWNFANENPSEQGKQKLTQLLDEFLKIPYTIIEHRSGIRPTVKDRRPIIGKHPDHKNVFVFNGMGTKGVQLVPFFANEFVEHLENGIDLMLEVDVKRFEGRSFSA